MRSYHLGQQRWHACNPCWPRDPASAISNTMLSASSSNCAGITSGRVVGAAGNIAAHFNQFAHDGTFADDFAIAPHIGGGRYVLCQPAQIGQASHLVQFPVRFPALRLRDHVYWFGQFSQPHNLAEDQSVFVAIKIFRHNQIGNLVHRAGFKQQAAQHRLLGLDRMRPAILFARAVYLCWGNLHGIRSIRVRSSERYFNLNLQADL